MSSTFTQPDRSSPVGSSPSYSPNTVKRAERALFCSPFQLTLFVAMRNASVPLPEIAGQTGFAAGYTTKVLSEGKTEKELMWLIKVGLLRREVDGQGITDSFRLTPLGRQLMEKWVAQGNSFPPPSFWEHLLNTLTLWLRLL
ncbi:MAG: hypothetical protein DSM107014_16305 [Gomphosphaeria aponina SAG 52.96 = DSM 107014]|uniref:Uncharacterized protein n=1 Tax=Gomphosphaeria aponina SAG 52.96 = DSM 107014 TaxID=1521640 RepID=A0A941GTA8_9CHRO|nr:hypothetical protein [Gomphosphaeria aponina SAG 52.96 = DSM 107014]